MFSMNLISVSVRSLFICFFVVIVSSATTSFADTKPSKTSVKVGENHFDVTAPKNQCLYKEFSKLEGDPAIVFFGACSRAKPSGMISLSIGTSNQRQTSKQLQAFFESSTGKAALARSKTQDGVVIEESRQKNGILFLRLTDKKGPLVPLTDNTVWRAMFQQSDHFFSVAYLPLASQQIETDEAFDRLYDFTLKFKRQNVRWIPAGLNKGANKN